MKKFISLFAILLLTNSITYSLEYSDINTPKEHAYRLGSENNIENKTLIQTKIQKASVKVVERKDVEKLTYADLSIKKISVEMSQNLEMDYDDMQSDLSILWQGAAMKSDTIKFALYKLANPDKDKPNKNAVKNVLTTIANMSTLVGSATGNPLLACASLVGGNTLGIMSQDTKELNYKYTQVTDTDVIILIKKVEDLQEKVVNTYFDYMTTKHVLDMTEKMVRRKYEHYENALSQKKEIILITDAYYREALNQFEKAKGNFSDARSRLEQLTGKDSLKQFENNLKSRNS